MPQVAGEKMRFPSEASMKCGRNNTTEKSEICYSSAKTNHSAYQLGDLFND
jgi:hypothetical protein